MKRQEVNQKKLIQCFVRKANAIQKSYQRQYRVTHEGRDFHIYSGLKP